MEKQVVMPVSKMTYSMLTQLLRNPLIFKLKHVLGVYDGKVGVSGMVGRAGHEALKVYYGAHPEIPAPKDPIEARALGMQHGLDYLTDYSDIYIDYGKTGSRENMLKTYTQAMQFYFAEEPDYHEILMMEKKLEGEIMTIDGQQLSLPAVGIPDLVHKRKDGGIEIIDTKFVKSFTDYETEDYIKIIQSQFLWHLLRAQKEPLTADRMLFREIKVTENSGPNKGQPQIRDYAIPFAHDQYRVFFYNIYSDAIKFLSNPDAVYLPNLSDPFDGEQAGLLYTQSLLSADMSDIEVMHKVRDVAYVSKKFVGSRLDTVENQHLLPEEKIKVRLAEFGIPIETDETIIGSSFTQYRFKVSRGIRMTTFEKHKADIATAIEAEGDIRILAPIPGTALLGIEVQNKNRTAVKLTKADYEKGSTMLPIGQTVEGKTIKMKLADMPHLLIAGTTGSGKSILVHTLIDTLTKQLTPTQLHLILIDPKRVELVAFAKAKHLHGDTIAYNHHEIIAQLVFMIDEMEQRYRTLETAGFRDITEYNANREAAKHLPYIVCVIDEFADIMLQSKQNEKRKKTEKSYENAGMKAYLETRARMAAKQGFTFTMPSVEEETPSAEDMIIRLAQMARAVGIHLIIATQRPSVDIITGLIKANFPTRIALTTSSATDSRVILGEDGAEKLTGKGDMIFSYPGGKIRLQGFMK